MNDWNTHLGKNTNHPRKGSSIKVEPIRDLEAIKKIKQLLAERPRDLCLFTFGINSAYRCGELLSITVGQVQNLKAGDRFEIKQSKNQRYRAITINQTVVDAIEKWLHSHPYQKPDAPLFISKKDKQALSVSAVNRMIKGWCSEVQLSGNFGTHSMRKTWGYHQRVQNNQPVPLLMAAFGHASEAQTLEYLCIQDGEISELYGMEL